MLADHVAGEGNHIAVIGAGSWGTALAMIAARNQLEVKLWAREPEVAGEINRTRRNPFYLSDFELPENIQATTVGYVGIAVALLGRSTAVGVGLAAFVFGALDYGTTRGLDPEVFDPTLAGNLSYMIQGMVVLFVGADILILYLWSLRRKRFASPRMAGRGV